MAPSALAVRSIAGGVFAAVLATAGCTGSNGGSESMTPEPSVRLVSTGGDVFGWEQRVSGEGTCDAVTPVVDGDDVDAPVDVSADGFSFVVPVHSGDQEVGARCVTGDTTTETRTIRLTGRLEPRPTARIDLRVREGAVILDGSRSEPFEVDGARIEGYSWSREIQIGHTAAEAGPTTPDGKPFDHARGRRITLVAPPQDGEYYVTLEVRDAEGRTDTSTSYFVVEGGRPRTVDLMHEHPSWIDDAIVYAPDHYLWGGGARAVRERLPYLKGLGIDALWLWPPVSRRAEGEFYEIVDAFSLDPEWGPPKEFRSMVDRAHELGLRVLLDFVPNHTSVQHPYYRAAEQEGQDSHYWDFYDRNGNGKATSYTDIFHNYLPNLNFENPQVRRMTIEAFSYWIRRFDIDGFRVDAAWAVERRAPDYWPEWREELKRIKPDLLLLAEATARESYYFRDGFDVGYDWTDHPGQWPWEDLWLFPQEIQSLLAQTLTNGGAGYPRDAIVLRFLNNNDTGPRFVQRHGVNLTRVASALEFTVPGIPLLFAGDEIGARYQPYETLEKIPWSDEHHLRPWYEELISLRRRHPALVSSDITIVSSNWGSVVSFVRPAVAGGDAVLVLLNFGEEASPTVARDPALDPFVDVPLEDALTGKPVSFAPGEPFRMPPRSVRVLVPAGGTS